MPKIVQWVEDNPLPAGGIIVVGGLAILWFFGFFSSSGSSAQGQADPNASAYYAAEATQAQFGAQMQIATINSAAATAQSQIAATAATTINAQNNTTSQLQSNNTLAATKSSNSVAAYIAQLQSNVAAYGAQLQSNVAGYQIETADIANARMTDAQNYATQAQYNTTMAYISQQPTLASIAASVSTTDSNNALISALANTQASVASFAPANYMPTVIGLTGLAGGNTL